MRVPPAALPRAPRGAVAVKRAASNERGGAKRGHGSVESARAMVPKAKYATAEEMGAAQREISVAEFFAKNRHLLGFDNPAKAVLTTVREAVDNSLDACEEAGILPDIEVSITHVRARKESTAGAPLPADATGGKKQRGFSGADRLIVAVQDNGPGIVKEQIPKIFGKLLYGSKFHRRSEEHTSELQ